MENSYKVIIDTNDVCHIMGKSQKAAWRYLKKIKHHYGKDPGHYVTVEEFCEYSGIAIELVHEYFRRGL